VSSSNCASGPDLKGGKLGSCPGPPQVGIRGLHKKNSKKGNIKTLFENDNLE